MNRKSFLATTAVSLALLFGSAFAADDRPNILWIAIEDWSPDLSCYGTAGIDTPHVDNLASQGIRYERAFTTSPVCSTSRSAMMTGFHQNYINANQHRLYPDQKVPLPYGIKPIPHIFAEAGYFTALMSRKTDTNFIPYNKDELFMGGDWNERKPGQPFFSVFNLTITHESRIRAKYAKLEHDPAKAVLPPYLPDTPLVRRDWARYHDMITQMDSQAAGILRQIAEMGVTKTYLHEPKPLGEIDTAMLGAVVAAAIGG